MAGPPTTATSSEARRRRFQIRDCLGRGGFGEVYRATMVSPGGLRSEVAIKILHDPNPDSLKRLRDEGKLLAALSHPAILKVHDLAGVGGNAALVTEYVDGADLSRLVGEGRNPLEPRAMLEVAGHVAEALHVAFTTVPTDATEPLRLVHRDIKPSNIRLSRHGEVKVLDFGIAWAQVAGREAKTNATALMGSLPYMAPERFSRQPAQSPSDIYSLGCTLFEGLTGERLHPEATPVDMARLAATVSEHDEAVEARLAELPRELPAEVGDLLRDMLSHDPAARPSGDHVSHRCETLADQVPGHRLRTWCREHPWEDPSGHGMLSGHTLSEQTLSGIDSASFSSGPVDSADTFALDDGGGHTFLLPEHDELPDLGPTRRRYKRPLAYLVVLALAVGGVSWWATRPTAPATLEVEGALPLAAPPAEPEPTPEPAAASTPEPTPGPDLRPSTSDPRPTTPDPRPTTSDPRPATSDPRPATSTPDPEVEIAPPPLAQATPDPGTVTHTGPGTLELRGPAGTYPPGPLPPGTYEVWADFGYGAHAQGRVEVVSGSVARIECNGTKHTCAVEY